MKTLIEDVLESNNNPQNVDINSTLGDGSYHSNENFNYLQKKRIDPVTKVRKNSIISKKQQEKKYRGRISNKQFLKWKKKENGKLWIIETAFFFNKENAWRIHTFNQIPKYDKRDDYESLAV